MTKTFTQTSDKPYTRHHYKLVYVNGNEVVFDNYQDVQSAWWNASSDFVKYIEVLDIPYKKSKGFK